MAALTQGRKTARRNGKVNQFLVATGSTIYTGAMVAINASSVAVPAGAVAAHKVVGVAQNQVTGEGVEKVTVFRDAAYFNNSASGDLITLADVMAVCYVVDDQTVAKTSNSSARPIAGKIIR